MSVQWELFTYPARSEHTDTFGTLKKLSDDPRESDWQSMGSGGSGAPIMQPVFDPIQNLFSVRSAVRQQLPGRDPQSAPPHVPHVPSQHTLPKLTPVQVVYKTSLIFLS